MLINVPLLQIITNEYVYGNKQCSPSMCFTLNHNKSKHMFFSYRRCVKCLNFIDFIAKMIQNRKPKLVLNMFSIYLSAHKFNIITNVSEFAIWLIWSTVPEGHVDFKSYSIKSIL